jgi:hypothetical protein
MYTRALVLLLSLLAPSAAGAKSWCAYPLFVHEWGVQVFDGAGRGSNATLLPPWFHRPGATHAARPRVPVRSLPADSGERDLPVVHFYSPRSDARIPVGLAVGFRHGGPLAWYPDVSALGGPDTPTAQLVWDRLDLSASPTLTVEPTDLPWIRAARALPSLWLSSERASERFVFYEGATREQVPLQIRRGATWAAAGPRLPARTHLELHNTGRHDVHDLLFVHRAGKHLYVFSAPSIPAGKSAGFVVEDHLVAGTEHKARTRGALAASLTDTVAPSPPTSYRWDTDRCVMMRDPAEPTIATQGHRLYKAEVDLVLEVWAERFFGKPGEDGTRIVYREDTAYLDEVMPLAVYTDMLNFVVLSRAGLALWDKVTLP